MEEEGTGTYIQYPYMHNFTLCTGLHKCAILHVCVHTYVHMYHAYKINYNQPQNTVFTYVYTYIYVRICVCASTYMELATDPLTES